MKLYEGSHIHDDVPQPEFKVRQSRRARSCFRCSPACFPAWSGCWCNRGISNFVASNRRVSCESIVCDENKGLRGFVGEIGASTVSFTRRDVLPDDVKIDILFCGVCHSDIHTARDEWGGTTNLSVRCRATRLSDAVVAVGRNVKKFKEAILAAVGVWSMRAAIARAATKNLEQFCEDVTFTYTVPTKISGGVTYGGYSTSIVVNESFVLRVRDNVDLCCDCAVVVRGDYDVFAAALSQRSTKE